MYRTITLPRQARDKHRKNLKKRECVFLQGEEEAAPAPTLSDETFVEVVTMIVKSEPFASQGYVWDVRF